MKHSSQTLLSTRVNKDEWLNRWGGGYELWVLTTQELQGQGEETILRTNNPHPLTEVYSSDPGCYQPLANSTNTCVCLWSIFPTTTEPWDITAMRCSIKVSVKLFIPLWEENGRRQTAQLTFEGGSCSDIQLGHKNQGNDRDILPQNNKGGGRDCFLSLTAAIKHTQSWGLQQWPGAGDGG